MPSYLYSNRLPFTNPLSSNLKQQLVRIDNKRASCIIVDGALGLGKTTLATHMADFINKEKGQPPIELKIKHHPQIALGGAEFSSCFRVTFRKGFFVVIYDEGGDFNRRSAISTFNQMINRLFETYRGFKILVIVCLPNFNILDNVFFDNQIPRMLIHITERGLNDGKFRVYSLSGMNWIRFWYDKLKKGTKVKCYSLVKPNFYGNFLNLPPAREKALDKLSIYGKTELLKKTEKKLKGLVTYKETSQKLNMSIEWIRKTIARLKIKEVAKQEHTKLFKDNVIDILADEIKQRR